MEIMKAQHASKMARITTEVLPPAAIAPLSQHRLLHEHYVLSFISL